MLFVRNLRAFNRVLRSSMPVVRLRRKKNMGDMFDFRFDKMQKLLKLFVKKIIYAAGRCVLRTRSKTRQSYWRH